MAHYAYLDTDGIVTDVITGIDESERPDGLTPEEWYARFRGQRCVRTSYNGNIRVRYAAIGDRYDEALDAFVPPQPYPSWTLDPATCTWHPPVPMPDGDPMRLVWDESTLSWATL